MKYSCYNSIIPLSEKSNLLYNSYSDSFIVFNAKLKDLIINNFEKLKDVNGQLYQMLIDSKCYVENDINEFERLRYYCNEYIFDDSQFLVIINPTLACNFKCWYCYENHIPNSKMPNEIKDRIYQLFNNIVNENKNLKSFALAFFGGEPLLQYKSVVVPFINAHFDLCNKYNLSHGISFTSNGALIKESMINDFVKFGPTAFQITLDGDEDFHNKVRYSGKNKGSYKLIISNIKMLIKNDIKVRLRINYTKENIHSIKGIVDDIKDISKNMKDNLTIDFHRVWQDAKDGEVRDLDEIRDIVNLFIDNDFMVKFNIMDEIRNSCYADKKNTLVLNYNGDVYKCTAKDFTHENRDGYLDEKGNIIWEKSQDYRRSLKLKNELCHNCRIAPLCGGGCTKYILEKEKKDQEYCVLKNSETLKDQIILDRFDYWIRLKANEEASKPQPTHIA